MKENIDCSKLLDLLKLFIIRNNKFEKFCLDEKKEATGEEKIRYDQKAEDTSMFIYELKQVIKKAFK